MAIKKELSIKNFNPIKSIFDLSKIKFAIQKAELERCTGEVNKESITNK